MISFSSRQSKQRDMHKYGLSALIFNKLESSYHLYSSIWKVLKRKKLRASPNTNCSKFFKPGFALQRRITVTTGEVFM